MRERFVTEGEGGVMRERFLTEGEGGGTRERFLTEGERRGRHSSPRERAHSILRERDEGEIPH